MFDGTHHEPVRRAQRPTLSAREVEVLTTWLRLGSKEAAAEKLFISPATVSTHIVRIRAKYAAAGREATTKSALFARAVQDGYTTLEEW
ncbi:LuxR family transcriptional regulator [Gordonia spumicola]|uniref:LuxR family transcriptional regulator n=1 Tax=Gordonia spumicola TaxID=589161 RepID=A0A7I9VBW0_9ACTN|nr:LuxR C-terminal-related transcriptional regulator [Gordonia spumicola]GEE02682.1 LuxR family transcriptional regulator [Gordonia spumicola]